VSDTSDPGSWAGFGPYYRMRAKDKAVEWIKGEDTH